MQDCRHCKGTAGRKRHMEMWLQGGCKTTGPVGPVGRGLQRAAGEQDCRANCKVETVSWKEERRNMETILIQIINFWVEFS